MLFIAVFWLVVAVVVAAVVVGLLLWLLLLLLSSLCHCHSIELSLLKSLAFMLVRTILSTMVDGTCLLSFAAATADKQLSSEQLSSCILQPIK